MSIFEWALLGVAILIAVFAYLVFSFDSSVYQQAYSACQSGIQSACETVRTDYWFVQFIPH